MNQTYFYNTDDFKDCFAIICSKWHWVDEQKIFNVLLQINTKQALKSSVLQ